MMKEFQKVPVYTKDSVSYIKGDKKKQEVIDDKSRKERDQEILEKAKGNKDIK